MHVQANDGLYRVSFSHPEVEVYLGSAIDPMGENTIEVYTSTRSTECKIRKVSSEKDRDGVVVAEAKAVCSVHDNFQRRVGRKISFKRAVEKLAPDNKEFRKTFWESYINNIRV